jgi:hypothetical protein
VDLCVSFDEPNTGVVPGPVAGELEHRLGNVDASCGAGVE